MKIPDFLSTPFPKPEVNKQKLLWILIIGLGCSCFILFYKPFGIQNDTGDWFVDLVIFSLGFPFILTILVVEGGIPRLFPRFFQKWTLGKALIWYSGLVLLLGMNNFLYKNFWGGFQEFTWLEFWYVLARTLSIGAIVSFFVLGIWNYINRKQLSLLSSNEDYLLSSQNGQSVKINLKDILYISSDDNYVDIHFEEEGDRKKIIFRSSLKNIEAQIVHPLSPISRCHRSYLINTKRFKILKMNSRAMTLQLNKHEDQVPVSKKYVDSIKQQL